MTSKQAQEAEQRGLVADTAIALGTAAGYDALKKAAGAAAAKAKGATKGK